MALAGCSDKPADGPKQTAPTPSSSATKPAPSASTDPTEAAKKEAVATYQGYWREVEKLYADQDGSAAGIEKFATSAALKNVKTDARRAHDDGFILTGDVNVIDPTVTELDIDRRIPNATISSCLDISQWETVVATTKKPVTLPSNRLTKYQILSVVEKRPEGWRVIRDEPQGKRC
jgi:hypothetical protein